MTFGGRLSKEFGEVLPDNARTYLSKVEAAAKRMFEMIEGVLRYSSVSPSQQELETIDLNEVIKDIRFDLELMIQQKRATITTDHLPTIEGYSILIYQLFYNLINNSLKFSKEHEGCVIDISAKILDQYEAEEGTSYVEITMTDNGIGFEQIYAERIFKTFSRLNSKDRFEGTGLGLSLCRKITERHGGEIEAEGKENGGAIFRVLLPLKQTKE